jgi:hypothetical protein
MNDTCRVLLLDDGELEDVRALLEQLGEAFVHLRGAAIPARIHAPSALLVATSRRALSTAGWPNDGDDHALPHRIVVVDGDSNTLRSMLRRSGVDLLVRRPVHPYALRLVLLRALYRGRERRRDDRVALGCEISLRSGLRRRTGILAELSLRGGRLLLKSALAPGSRITLHLPPELTAGRGLALRAKVVRSRADAQGWQSVALAFEQLGSSTRERLTRLLRDRREGPWRLPKGAAAEAGATLPQRPPLPPPGPPRATEVGKDHTDSAPAEADAPPATAGERRLHRRIPFRDQVMTLGDRASLVLMGRDISRGGMRVDPEPGLEEGMTLRLAIYGAIEDQPFLVRARVVRDDGAAGLGIAFEDVTPEVAERLEALVARLPYVESLDDEAEAMGSVVSEIVEVERP